MRFIVKVPKKLLNYKSRFVRAIQKATTKIEDAGLKGIQNSIQKRWFRTGNSLKKVTFLTNIGDDSNKVSFLSGTDYDQFGEYGTGRRGGASRPDFIPKGWNYGSSVMGMNPRFMFHQGIDEVIPEFRKDFVNEIRKAL